MHIRLFHRDDTDAVIDLWNRCGLTRPWNDPQKDIERKLAVDDGLFLVGVEAPRQDHAAESLAREAQRVPTPSDDPIISVAMAGYDGHRGWVNYLAVDPRQRGRGLGRLMMAAVETRLLARGCPKLNLQVRTGNDEALAFYATLGYSIDATTSLGKRLIADD